MTELGDPPDWMTSRLAAITSAVETFESCTDDVANLVAEAGGRGTTELLRVHVELAAIFAAGYEDEQVVAHLDRALQISAPEPEQLALRLCALKLLTKCEGRPEAEALLREALDLVDERTPRTQVRDGFLALGSWYLRLERWADAVDPFIRAVAVADRADVGSFLAAHEGAGIALGIIGAHAEAEVHERAILALGGLIDPDAFTDAEQRLARLLSDRGAHEQARRLLEAHVAAAPTVLNYLALIDARRRAGDQPAAEAARAEGQRVALAEATREIDADLLAWLGSPGDPQIAIERLAVDIQFRSHGEVDDADALSSQSVFGPVRDYTCGCGTLRGFERYGTTCQTCYVQAMPSAVRRWRLGNVRLRHRVVHPRAKHLVALLLDIHDAEVDEPDVIDRVARLHLPSLRDDLARLAARRQLRHQIHPIAERIAVAERFHEANVQLAAVLVQDVPVVSPDAMIDGVDHARLRDAYLRLLAANAPPADPGELGRSSVIADAVRGVFACFGPLPDPPPPPAVGETHVPPFDLPNRVVGHPTFASAGLRHRAGTGFVLADRGGRRILVTAWSEIPGYLEVVERVHLVDAFDREPIGSAGPALRLPMAARGKPARDVAAFALELGADTPTLRLATSDAERDERVFIAGMVRVGAPASQRLHPATAGGVAVDNTLVIKLDVPTLDLNGLSGAPVLRRDGSVVGMLSHGSRHHDPHELHAFVLPSSQLRLVLDSALGLRDRR